MTIDDVAVELTKGKEHKSNNFLDINKLRQAVINSEKIYPSKRMVSYINNQIEKERQAHDKLVAEPPSTKGSMYNPINPPDFPSYQN